MPRFLDQQCACTIVSECAARSSIAKLLVRLLRHHGDTLSHSVRVADFATDLALECCLPSNDVALVAQAALLHDIGKLQVPLTILDKRAALTEAERQLIIQHPRFGFDLLAATEFNGVREIVVAHHEWKSHDPYPRTHAAHPREAASGLVLLQQIVAIADTIDALLSGRPYKPSYSIAEVRQLLAEHFAGDPALLERTLQRL